MADSRKRQESMSFATGARSKLADKLFQYVHSAERVLFCNSGFEAAYNPIWLAGAVTERTEIMCQSFTRRH
jgi:glutamate-1-semialdehyde aminotransferase